MQVTNDVIVPDQAATEQSQKRTDIPASVRHDYDVLDGYTKLGNRLRDLTESLAARHGDKDIGATLVVSHERPKHFGR